MPYANSHDAGDFEKLQAALGGVLKSFGSSEAMLEAFGLAELPTAQRYGIFFGILVFTCTVAAVIALLVLGGTFRRIMDQAKTGENTVLAPHEHRAMRALLLERLLEGRERMLTKYPTKPTTTGRTELTNMLCTVAPTNIGATPPPPTVASVEKTIKNGHAGDPNGAPPLSPPSVADSKEDSGGEKGDEEPRKHIPPYYEENYIAAYRKCQDRPGGSVLPGRPEARMEAYARGFAGCGPYTSLWYRRSYARMYEALCCASHKSDDRYQELYKDRPEAIVGRYVRLEALDVDRHLEEFFQITSGQAIQEHNAYDPNEVWGFLPEGPFQTVEDVRKSYIFDHSLDQAHFAIIHSVTERLIGVIMLIEDNPQNLSIQLEAPIIHPKLEGSRETLEVCFLLLDRLFAAGYRRVQVCIDAQDVAKRKFVRRLGLVHEGLLHKHMVVKEASRDSDVYGLLNSDWTSKGARPAMFKRLYGDAACRADMANEKREQELDEQQRRLDEQKQQEAASAVNADDKKHI